MAMTIHVPSWGTTQTHQGRPNRQKFQSTFPRGERLELADAFARTSEFQSTFPRGERRQIFTNILCFFMQ